MELLSDLYRTVLENVQEGVYCIDGEHRITFWNKAAERITGFAAADVIGTRCRENLLDHVDGTGQRLCGGACPLTDCFRTGRETSRQIYLHHKKGHRIPVSVRATPILAEDGRLVGAIETFSDISSSIAAIDKINALREIALLDPVTRLGNRRSTEAAIARRLEEMRRYAWPFGLLFIDIDSFKLINDTFGHETGDHALRMVGTTLEKSLRQFDFAGRWGGDEFVAVLVNVSEDELRSIAERLRLLVSNSNVSRFRNPLWITVSMGATLARREDSTASLLQRADELMYRSKRDGKNRVTCDRAGAAVETAGAGLAQS